MSKAHGAAVILAGGVTGTLGQVEGILEALIGAGGLIGAAVLTQIYSDRRRERVHRRYDATAITDLTDPMELMQKLIEAHEEVERVNRENERLQRLLAREQRRDRT